MNVWSLHTGGVASSNLAAPTKLSMVSMGLGFGRLSLKRTFRNYRENESRNCSSHPCKIRAG